MHDCIELDWFIDIWKEKECRISVICRNITPESDEAYLEHVSKAEIESHQIPFKSSKCVSTRTACTAT